MQLFFLHFGGLQNIVGMYDIGRAGSIWCSAAAFSHGTACGQLDVQHAPRLAETPCLHGLLGARTTARAHSAPSVGTQYANGLQQTA